MDSTEILDEIPTEIPLGSPMEIFEESPSLNLEVKQKLQEDFLKWLVQKGFTKKIRDFFIIFENIKNNCNL